MKVIELEIRLISLINKRNILFALLSIGAVGMIYTPLRDLLANPTRSEYYSHILLIPLVSGFFLYMGRKKIFSNLKYSYSTGIPLIIIGVVLYVLGWSRGVNFNQNDYTSLMNFSVLLFWIGAFILFFGTQGFRMAIFPLLFLVFMIPIPSILMEKTISVLLAGSTAATHMLFIYPITVLKNGIRIVTLSSLAVYVDERFITQSFLHRSGGFLFYIPALFLLGIVLWWLRKTEPTLSK